MWLNPCIGLLTNWLAPLHWPVNCLHAGSDSAQQSVRESGSMYAATCQVWRA